MHIAYLALGSNIDPEKNLYFAWATLNQTQRALKSSSIWESPPIGSKGSNFLNAVIHLETDCDYEDLKWKILRPLETKMGRIRTADKFAPRQIDLDILIFDGILLELNLWLHSYLASPCSELLPDLANPETGQPLSVIAEKIAKEQHTILRCSSFSSLKDFSSIP
jgi:2-amino-4-hydroxy-6-hydroxymethyldihydropteridine diphosphokinase